MSVMEFNQDLFIMEFISNLENESFYLKKSFDTSSKGDRFFRVGENKNKAFGRYKYIPADSTTSGYPMIMWTVFQIQDKTGKVISESRTNYFWFKPENESGNNNRVKPVIDKEEYQRKLELRRKEEEDRQKSFSVIACSEYQEIKKSSIVPAENPYTNRKRIPCHRGVLVSNIKFKVGSYYNQYKEKVSDKSYHYVSCNDLIIPLINVNNEFVTYQTIRPDGSKRQRVDISTVGAFFPISTLDKNTKRVWLCEGYATGCSLYSALNEVVVVCFDVSNVWAVALALRSTYPDIEIVFCTDNDRKKKTKVGLFKGFEYSYLIDAPFVFPKFEEIKENEDRSDWNDLAEIWNPSEMADLLNRQIDYFKAVGKERAIKAACESYSVSREDLLNHAEEVHFKTPNLFKTVFEMWL